MKKLGGAALIAAIMVLSGCAAGAPVTEAAPSATASTPAGSSESTPVAAAPPQACVDYERHPAGEVEGGAAIIAAASTAVLPSDVVLNPGVQVITSVDQPGMLEAVARVCSTPMTEPELIAVANEIAIAIKADPSNETLAVLVVSEWSPGADGYLQNGESVTTDYQTYTWDPAAAASMDVNWK